MITPRMDRPEMPPGYGPTDGLDATLPWSWAELRLRTARSYWLATVGADGAPHVAPVWAAWAEDALWFGTDPASAKGRNLARDHRVAVHLESGDEVVIVHGRAEPSAVGRLDPDRLATVDEAYAAKYADPETGEPMRLSATPEEGSFYRVVPERVLGWREDDFLRSRTRWWFDG
jgi:PPOX class probable F420-dependent enzyme